MNKQDQVSGPQISSPLRKLKGVKQGREKSGRGTGGGGGGVLDVWCFIRTHHIPLALRRPILKIHGRHPWHPAGADGIPVW